jgi:condensin-2 complex subunit D3
LAALDVAGLDVALFLKAWDELLARTGSEHIVPVLRGGSTSDTKHVLASGVLRVLAFRAQDLPRTSAERLARDLCRRLGSLSMPSELIQAATRVVEGLDEAGRLPRGQVAAWRTSLMRTVELRIGVYAQKQDDTTTDAELSTCLFTLGAIASCNQSAISDGAVAALQTIVAGAAKKHAAKGASPAILGSNAIAAPAIVGSHAIAALGKLCLRQEMLAKRCVELFVLNMESKQPLAVRNSALIVLGDLCQAYTSLVDRFVPCLANLLKEPNELLRKQSVMIIASLLSESFVKFRGPLVYRLLYSLSDPSNRIRGIVECIFQRMLLRRNPACLSQIFGDTICALNAWLGHPRYSGAEGNEEFSLRAAPDRRIIVYQFILSTLTRDQKFNVCSQLVTGFLSAFVDEEMHLKLPTSESSPSGQALHDVLALLSCQEMRICFTAATSVDDDVALDETGAPGADAARTALSGVLRRVVCENIVPVLLQLKTMMEAERSPFLGRLRRCLCEVLREFKDELSDLLGDDKRLVQEITHDMKAASASLPAKVCLLQGLSPSAIGNRKQQRQGSPERTENQSTSTPVCADAMSQRRESVSEEERPRKRLKRVCSDGAGLATETGQLSRCKERHRRTAAAAARSSPVSSPPVAASEAVTPGTAGTAVTAELCESQLPSWEELKKGFELTAVTAGTPVTAVTANSASRTPKVVGFLGKSLLRV